MKTKLFFFACLLLSVVSCRSKISTDDNDYVMTVDADVQKSSATLKGRIFSTVDRDAISEAGFLVSDQSGFRDKNARTVPAAFASEEPEFTATVTIDELGVKRGDGVYFKAYIVTEGKREVASEKSFIFQKIPVSGISLDKSSVGITRGQTVQLVATVTPEDATDATVVWSSSDEKVATVSQTGLVTSVGKGSATITAAVSDKEAQCDVKVRGTAPAGFKDLGLSVYWAEKNLLANSPEEAGEYYRYGYISTCQDFNTTNNSYTFPVVDPQTKDFGPEYDAAYQINALWRTPSENEFKELIDKCNKSSETKNGVKVVRMTSKINGESIIFSSETGKMIQKRVVNQPYHASYGPYGFFRSRTSYGSQNSFSFSVNHQYTVAEMDYSDLSSGIPIRPVSDGE